jgi:hypothetical protein
MPICRLFSTYLNRVLRKKDGSRVEELRRPTWRYRMEEGEMLPLQKRYYNRKCPTLLI